MDLVLERSTWSERSPKPSAVTTQTLLDYHGGRYVDWLAAAGAEPRLALVLCSGEGLKERWVASLETTGVNVVRAPATVETPIHPALAAHEGDHFNSKLFVVDGFEVAAPGNVFAALGPRRSSLSRKATWVAVVIESLPALEALYRAAPLIPATDMRRVLILDEAIAAPAGAPLVEPAMLARWRRGQRVAELAYHAALATDRAPAYHDFSRLIRTGYAALIDGGAVHPDVARVLRVWREREAIAQAGALPFELDGLGAGAAEAIARHVPAEVLQTTGREAVLRALLKDAAARYAAGLPAEDEPVLALMERLRDAASGAGPAGGSGSTIAELRERVQGPEVGVNLWIHAELAIAAAAAAADDLDTCERALASADRRASDAAGVAPELAFDVIEKNSQMHAWRNRRGQARAALGRLVELAPVLVSPFYEARADLARAESVSRLDPPKSRTWFDAAAVLFAAFGYPSWLALTSPGGT